MGDRPLCSSFPHPYHLSEKRLHLVASIFPFSVSSLSISLGFRCPLTDRETTDLVSLLSILLDQTFHHGNWEERFLSLDS